MRYVSAALLAALGEKSIDSKNIKNILGSVGIEAESDKVDLVVKQLAGKNLEELMAQGHAKLASMPAGGGGGAAAAPAAGGSAAPAADAGAAKEEKKEEPEEESDDDMGFGLFD